MLISSILKHTWPRRAAPLKVHVTEHIYIYVALIYAPREACAAVGAVNEMIFAYSIP